MEKLTQIIEKILQEIQWEYKLYRLEDNNSFELQLQVGDNTPTHININIIDIEERFYGYEIVCTKREKLPSDFIPNGILLANRFNADYSHVNCAIDNDGTILFIGSRSIRKDINRDDLLFDISETVKACDSNTQAMIETATCSNEIDMTSTSSFELI